MLEKQRSLVFEMADRAVTEAPDSLVSQALSYFQRATFKVNLAQFLVKHCTVNCGDLRRWLRRSTKVPVWDTANDQKWDVFSSET